MPTNRLANEKSPYLLQHAHNPVDWYAWGKDAFEKARREDKPIFLSIGYSTCHWCHVMEKESFENDEIARVMNEHYVSIKVDREERPDIDHIYMTAVQAMTGSGGWPLSAFLTHDQKPFYGGTYFPPEDRWGRPGFKTLLVSIAEAWKVRRGEIVSSAEGLTNLLRERKAAEAVEHVELDDRILRKAYEQFNMRFDARFGGFGQEPKFPRSHELSFLLRYARRSGQDMALQMAERTLEEMARGGMYDQLGGGFHRYSTDAYWHVPHFEKMLYDQAILAKTYLEAFQATGKKKYADTAHEIFEYVLRDLAAPEGGFFSAEDADSMPPEPAKDPLNVKLPSGEKSEGAFYIWSEEEIKKSLSADEAHAFIYRYGVEPAGNARSDPMGEFKGKNILYNAHSLEDTAKFVNKPLAEIEPLLSAAKKKLFELRNKRPRPHRDDKIMTDWNGLMIASLSVGSRVLSEPRYRDAAKRAADFILATLRKPDGRLLHRYADREAGILATLDDYAFFIYGLIELYQATFDVKYLKEAKRLTEEMIRLFWDKDGKGFFITATDGEPLIIRSKELYDGATPSGNSMAMLDLILLGRMTVTPAFERHAEELSLVFSTAVDASPTAFTQFLIALDFVLGPSREIVISGSAQTMDVAPMVREVFGHFIPNKVVVFRPTHRDDLDEAVAVIPFIEGQGPLRDKATAYVCENYACKLPTNELAQLKTWLTNLAETPATSRD